MIKNPRFYYRSPLLIAGVTFLLLLATSFFIYFIVARNIRWRAWVRFENRVDNISDTFDKSINRYFEVLNGFKGLFAASHEVERLEFHKYYEAVGFKEKFPQSHIVSFVERLAAPIERQFIEKVQVDRSVRLEGYPNFKIFPNIQKNEYFVANYIEPYNDGMPIHGFDVSSDEKRFRALVLARDTGELTATEPVISLRDDTLVINVYLPIYQNGLPAKTVEDRRSALMGFVGGGFRTGPLFSGILGEQDRGIEVEVFGGGNSSEDIYSRSRLVYDSAENVLQAKERSKLLATSKDVMIGGQILKLYFTAPRNLGLDLGQRSLPPIALGLGTVFSFLISGVAYYLLSSRSRAVAMAEEITQKLKAEESKHQFITDNSQDVIARISVNGIFQYVSPSSIVFGYVPEKLVGRSFYEFIATEDLEMFRKIDPLNFERSNNRHPITFRFKTGAGDRVWVEATFQRVVGAVAHDLGGFIAVLRNVTEREQVLSDLKSRTDELEKLNKLMVGRELRIIELKKALEKLKDGS